MAGIKRCLSIESCDPHNISGVLWEYEGIKGDTSKPDLVGSKAGVAIICAGAKGVYEELEFTKKLLECLEPKLSYEILCVNEIGQFIHENVYAIVTAHPEWAASWLEWRSRPQRGSLNKPLIFSDSPHPEVDVLWSGLGYQVGTSGMLACLIAICMGYEKIILCGMPMNFKTPHFFNNYSQEIDPINLHIYTKSWEYVLNKLPTFKKKLEVALVIL